MRVLHIGYYGASGGAGGAVVTRNLHFGLRNAGIDSTILCREGSNESLHIKSFQASRIEKRIDSLVRRCAEPLGLNGLDGFRYLRLRKADILRESEIINIHRIYAFLSYLSFLTFAKEKPTVLTMHDMWSFTGHCYASLDCERWKTGCGKCPYPHVLPRIRRDNTKLEWKFKKWIYERSQLYIVTLSRRQTEQVKQSMLSRFPIYHIPNGINTTLYQPLDPQKCRSLLGIPENKRVIMFMSVSLNNYIKGGDLLVRAMSGLPKSLKAQTVLLLLGHDGDDIARSVDMETIQFGYVSNDRIKSMCFSAADLFIHPTRADSLPMVIQESMSCGTPVVSFRVGGVPDLVQQGVSGYLAEPENADDLSRGIMHLLGDRALLESMREKCREIILRDFPLELQVSRYIDLYRTMIFERR
jgi:glycosyltransferase involved in cell wall biosynthesis